jgi:DNA-binding MarR family transcriptional regulator
MKPVKSKMQTRQQLIGTVLEAYMDLFAMMQSAAVDHWLMFELTFAQARALIILAAHKALTVSQLARLLKVGNSTASILVQALVERGLVTRTEDEADRRHTILRLSEQGVQLSAGRRKERAGQWQRWLGGLSDEELNALARGLMALRDVVRTETGYGPAQPKPAPKHKTP